MKPPRLHGRSSSWLMYVLLLAMAVGMLFLGTGGERTAHAPGPQEPARQSR